VRSESIAHRAEFAKTDGAVYNVGVARHCSKRIKNSGAQHARRPH
jgi:hypothetical protein